MAKIEVRNLTKTIHNNTVLEDINLCKKSGRVYGFQGIPAMICRRWRNFRMRSCGWKTEESWKPGIYKPGDCGRLSRIIQNCNFNGKPLY